MKERYRQLEWEKYLPKNYGLAYGKRKIFVLLWIAIEKKNGKSWKISVRGRTAFVPVRVPSSISRKIRIELVLFGRLLFVRRHAFCAFFRNVFSLAIKTIHFTFVVYVVHLSYDVCSKRSDKIGNYVRRNVGFFILYRLNSRRYQGTRVPGCSREYL